MKTEKFQVTGMICASCQAHVTKEVPKMRFRLTASAATFFKDCIQNK